MNEAPVTSMNTTTTPALSVAKKPAKSATIKKLQTPPQPDEETVARLNNMAKEYPYCVINKPQGNGGLL
ncbi:MAG: hypothetical protein QM731_12250 [Chitinophagaceae bacterium]